MSVLGVYIIYMHFDNLSWGGGPFIEVLVLFKVKTF
jgi:hypothetical protein